MVYNEDAYNSQIAIFWEMHMHVELDVFLGVSLYIHKSLLVLLEKDLELF